MSIDSDQKTTTRPTVEEVRRRRARRAWIPSLLSLLILLTMTAVVLVVQAQGIGSGRTVPPAVGPHGYSKFDAEGMRYISDTRTVWFDLRTQPMRADALRLPPTATTSVGSRGEIGNFLGLYGAGSAVKLTVDSIDITTAAGNVTTIDATATANGTFSDVRDDLAAASAYGLDAKEVTDFLEQSLRHNRAGESYSQTLGPGTALSVPISVSVACSTAAQCAVHYVVWPRGPG